MIFDATDRIPFGMIKSTYSLLAKMYKLNSPEDFSLPTYDSFDDFIKEDIIENAHILIYQKDMKAVGCVYLNNYEYLNEKFYKNENGCMKISNLYVLDEYRHMGIATELLKRAEEIAKEEGVCSIASSYFDDNKASENLHKKNGYKVIKTEIQVIKDI